VSPGESTPATPHAPRRADALYPSLWSHQSHQGGLNAGAPSKQTDPRSPRRLEDLTNPTIAVNRCYTVRMSNSHLIRAAISDREWLDIQAAALYSGVSTPQLIANVLRAFLRDPKRSPIVRRRQPHHRPVIKRGR